MSVYLAMLVLCSVEAAFGCLPRLNSRQGGPTLIQARDTILQTDYKSRTLQKQLPIPSSTKFPCDVTMGRSPQRPSSVHRLRPGDVDVVGAMGDSIMAAFGADAVDIPSVLLGNRGMSFAVGGAETWRSLFTLPNVLKLFNPGLVGFSLGDGNSISGATQLNVAEGFAASSDMMFQARLLVQRMKDDPRVDFQRDWKMVTLFMGANDFCHWICYVDPKYFVGNHRRDLINTLNYLRDNIPRLFLNLVPPPNIARSLFTLAPSASCFFVNNVECSCLFQRAYRDKLSLYDALMNEWQNVDIEITRNPEYLNKDDFAVVVQPFTLEVTLPKLNRTAASGKAFQDPTFFAPDCFHFSQKTHAIAGNALWNNMMEPVGSKSRDWNHRLMESVKCPDANHPYIYTPSNSNSMKSQIKAG